MKAEKSRSISKRASSSRGSSPVSVSSNSSFEDSDGGESRSHNSSTREAINNSGAGLRSELFIAGKTRRTTLRRSLSIQEASLQFTAGTLVSAVVISFSLYFPFWLAPEAALKTYNFARWEYDAEFSLFDNTAWTYGTDYFLAVCMLALISAIPCSKQSTFYHAGWHTRGLLASYMISVAAGGFAHQFYKTVESQNTSSFRMIWTVCVGAVAAASGFMGATATELLCLDHRGVDVVIFPGTSLLRRRLTLPVIPGWFWSAYAVSVTAIVVAGGFSFQRPACDIFVVGITQFPSTFYMMLILYADLQKCDTVSNRVRAAGCCGFILNAPLLPMYPILVQYTDWSLGSINTLLHAWLLVAWSMQGLVLRHVGYAVMKTEEPQLLLDDANQRTITKETAAAPFQFRQEGEVVRAAH